MTRLVLEIDGKQFTTLEGFYDEVSRKLIPGYDWGVSGQETEFLSRRSMSERRGSAA